jgi:hypothetical protein
VAGFQAFRTGRIWVFANSHNAVKQWTYTPTLIQRCPTPIIMTVTVCFNLD